MDGKLRGFCIFRQTRYPIFVRNRKKMLYSESDSRLLFSAPLVPGKASWVQQYFRLSRFFTLPAILITGIGLILLWEKLAVSWIIIVAVMILGGFFLLHYVVARIIADMEMDQWHSAKICATDSAILLYFPEEEPLVYSYKRAEQMRVIFSGYEKAWFPSGKYFSGSRNQISFKYGEKNVDITFRLISPAHFSDFKEFLSFLYDAQIPFDEYNSTSGLPVKTRMLS
ncbi:MAG: hypothetical protein R3C61_13620 [Bacteroidia bacterium]